MAGVPPGKPAEGDADAGKGGEGLEAPRRRVIRAEEALVSELGKHIGQLPKEQQEMEDRRLAARLAAAPDALIGAGLSAVSGAGRSGVGGRAGRRVAPGEAPKVPGAEGVVAVGPPPPPPGFSRVLPLPLRVRAMPGEREAAANPVISARYPWSSYRSLRAPCTVESGWSGWISVSPGVEAISSFSLGLYFMVQLPSG